MCECSTKKGGYPYPDSMSDCDRIGLGGGCGLDCEVYLRGDCKTPPDEEVPAASEEQSNYSKYRGKCQEYSEQYVREHLGSRLVRGWYDCPIWGRQEHWWAEEADGTIVDLTKNQFPSRGIGEYIEFDGVLECAQCGQKVPEETAVFNGHYPFCSYPCAMRFVGL